MKIVTLFEVVSGDFHAIKELDTGNIPLVSCGDTDNGVMDYFDIPKDKQYHDTITVAYNGSWPIMSKFHPYAFGAKDDVAVLIPRHEISRLGLLYTAALFNRMTWRYSYGRKCFKGKLEDVDIAIPTITKGGVSMVDEEAVRKAFPRGVGTVAKEIAKTAGDWALTT